MEILKKIARKILADEIKEYKNNISNLEREKDGMVHVNQAQFMSSAKEKGELLEEKCKLEKENEILRQYYDLDKEPSDEIKAKIHIDLEINRLKEEMMKMLVMQSRQPIYYMPPSYPFGRGF